MFTLQSITRSAHRALLAGALALASLFGGMSAVVAPVATVASAVAPAVAVTAIAAVVTLAPVPAQAQSLSDYTENNTIDYVFRAQTWTIAANMHVGLSTAACSDSSVGTEVTGGSYARVSYARSLANWAGTQSAGSTTASSGTGGVTSNNAAVSFATPSAGWGTVTHFFISDASTGGNIILCQALTTSKTINSGDTVSFPIASITVTFQ